MPDFPIFKSFQRVGDFPLTSTEVFATLEDLITYASTDATVYTQKCIVTQYGKSTIYVINPDKTVVKLSEYFKYYTKIVYDIVANIPYDLLSDWNTYLGVTSILDVTVVDSTVMLYSNDTIDIANDQFKDNNFIVEFESDAVVSIGTSSFENCGLLQSIKLPNLVTLSMYCFGELISLTTLHIPKVNILDGEINDYFKNVVLLEELQIDKILQFYADGEMSTILVDLLTTNTTLNSNGITFINDLSEEELSSRIGNLETESTFDLSIDGIKFEIVIRNNTKNLSKRINVADLSTSLGINTTSLASLITENASSLLNTDTFVISKDLSGTVILQNITYAILKSSLKSYFDTLYPTYVLSKAAVEAVLTGTITSHNHTGVYFPSTHEFIIDPYNIVWENDWIKVTHGSWSAFYYKNYYGFVHAVVETGAGHINIRCKIRRPKRADTQVWNGLYWEANETFYGFYLKDLDNVLTPATEFGRIIIKFQVEQPGGTANGADVDGETYKWSTPNVIVDDTNSDGVEHGTWMKNTYLWKYNQIATAPFVGDVILTEDDATLHEPNQEGGGILNTNMYSNYCRLHNANLIMEAFLDGLSVLSANGNPDILTFVCHHSNSNEQWNYVRPDYNLAGDSVFSSFHDFPINTIACGAGDPTALDATWQTSYGEGVEFIEPTTSSFLTGITPSNPWATTSHQQSPATAIISAKFRYIKDQTGVSWNTVRLACRATGSQAGVWNKYRGYGVIDTAAAIIWIEALKTSIRPKLAERYEEGSGYASFMEYEDFTSETPLPKRLVEEYVTQFLVGGKKLFFFEKIVTVGTYYRATNVLPTRSIQEIAVATTADTTVIASFLTDVHTTAYIVLEGTRVFNVVAKSSSPSKQVQLIGNIYLTDVAGANPILLRTSNLSDILTDTNSNHSMYAVGTTLNIPVTNRVLFEISAVKVVSGGTNPTITISVEDDTYSRLEVPAPTSSTDISGKVNTDQTSPQTLVGQFQFPTAKFGSSSHYTEFEADGTRKAVGNATTHRDALASAINLQQTGVGVSINLTENTVDYLKTANAEDYMIASIQINHDRKLQTNISPHIHWWQTSAVVPNFAIQYRWQRLGQLKETSWTALKCTTLVFTWTSGTLHQITYTNDIVSPANDNISDILEFRIIRDTTNGLGLSFAADPLDATVSVMSFDLHIECDTDGSRTRTSK